MRGSGAEAGDRTCRRENGTKRQVAAEASRSAVPAASAPCGAGERAWLGTGGWRGRRPDVSAVGAQAGSLAADLGLGRLGLARRHPADPSSRSHGCNILVVLVLCSSDQTPERHQISGQPPREQGSVHVWQRGEHLPSLSTASPASGSASVATSARVAAARSSAIESGTWVTGFRLPVFFRRRFTLPIVRAPTGMVKMLNR